MNPRRFGGVFEKPSGQLGLAGGIVLGVILLAGALTKEESVSLAAPSSAGSIIASLILFFLAAAIYLIPSIIAVRRHHRNLPALIALNVLLGWTFFGWVAALVWALYRPQVKDSWEAQP